jgi:hypothetical protein
VAYTEQRKYPRLPVLVDCRIEGASGRSTMRLTDLSPRGCFVDTSITFPNGAPVTLYASLGDSEVALPGRVINMPGGSGFGVEFMELGESARQKLDAYIQERSQ